jgi:DNA repair exonuclease SbcCD ATPase subunit
MPKARLETNRQHLAKLKQAYGTYERMREALPLIARRKEIHEALLAFEGVPDLPEDFGEKRREVENTLTIAANDVKRIQKTITDCREKISALSVPEELLRDAPMIEALQHDLGSFKKAQQDRPVLEARMRALRKQASDKLSQAGIAASYRKGKPPSMTPVVIGEIQEMGQTHERLVTRLDSVRERRRQLETEIAAVGRSKKTLPSPMDVSAIKAILRSAQNEGPLEKRLAETRNAIIHR